MRFSNFKKIPWVITIILLLAFPLKVSAHLAGQPPFLQVNGKFANLYPVPLTSLEDFNLPQDAPPEDYYVNQEINFQLALKNLPPAPPDVVARTKFTWDFGDGSKGEGVSEKHTYTSMGSYFLDIYADDGTTPTPQLIEKILLNILPDKNYKLPKAVIAINNAESKDPVNDILQFNYNKPISLDASHSIPGTAKIVSYFWDLGDQQTSTDITVTHQYSTDLTQVFPVLRIKDSNGFISDAYVEMKNSPQETTLNITDSSSPSPQSKPASSSSAGLIILGILFVIACVVIGLILKKSSK